MGGGNQGASETVIQSGQRILLAVVAAARNTCQRRDFRIKDRLLREQDNFHHSPLHG